MSRAHKPIFPTPDFYDEKIIGVTDGLTIREHFAAMAMAGALGGVPGAHLLSQTLARDSVIHADALIAELAKPVQQ